MKKTILIGVILLVGGFCLIGIGKETSAINIVGAFIFLVGIGFIVKGIVDVIINKIKDITGGNKNGHSHKTSTSGVKKLKPGTRLDVYDGRLTQIKDLDEVLNIQDYVVLDVETTGLDPAAERIIEIAALKIENGSPSGKYQTLVDPGKELPPIITDLTGLTTEQVRAGKQYQTMVEEVDAFVGKLPIVAHNSSFDTKFLSAAFVFFGRYGDFNHIDTVALAKTAFPGMPNYKLATLIPQLGLSDHAQTHRAMDDALCVKELFDRCRNTIHARGKMSTEIDTVKAITESSYEKSSVVDLFLAYEQADAAIQSARAKDIESAEIIFGSEGEYLTKAFSRPISDAIEREFNREKKSIQKLKTRKAIFSHIERFMTIFATNADKLSSTQKKRVSECGKDLVRICDMVAPEK